MMKIDSLKIFCLEILDNHYGNGWEMLGKHCIKIKNFNIFANVMQISES